MIVIEAKKKYYTKKELKEWIRRMKKKNINWAQWGGWFDSDGSFSNAIKKSKNNRPYRSRRVALKLKDKDPVEFFAKQFETTLHYYESNTKTPNGNTYRAKSYEAILIGPRAVWFSKKIKKYILQKTDYLRKIFEGTSIVYEPYKQSFTKEEMTAYLATLIEGDGVYGNRKLHPKRCYFSISSIQFHFLNYLKKETLRLGITNFGDIYKNLWQSKGTPRKNILYRIEFKGNMLEAEKSLLQLLPYMTMDRKIKKVSETLNWINQRK